MSHRNDPLRPFIELLAPQIQDVYTFLEQALAQYALEHPDVSLLAYTVAAAHLHDTLIAQLKDDSAGSPQEESADA